MQFRQRDYETLAGDNSWDYGAVVDTHLEKRARGDALNLTSAAGRNQCLFAFARSVW